MRLILQILFFISKCESSLFYFPVIMYKTKPLKILTKALDRKGWAKIPECEEVSCTARKVSLKLPICTSTKTNHFASRFQSSLYLRIPNVETQELYRFTQVQMRCMYPRHAIQTASPAAQINAFKKFDPSPKFGIFVLKFHFTDKTLHQPLLEKREWKSWTD